MKCGYAFCEYEHIDPEFNDATEHDPTKMALLCRRCHGEVTARRASKESVWAAKKAPFCKRGKPNWGPMEFGELTSTFGRMMFFDSRVLLRVMGEDLLSIAPPEEFGGPIRVNARLFDGDRVALEIEDNTFSSAQDNWDVEIEGPLLTIRRSLGEPSLVYRFVPKSGVRIERAAMEYKGVRLDITADEVKVGSKGSDISTIGAHFMKCGTCISIDEGGVTLGNPPLPNSVRLPSNTIIESCQVRGGLHVRSGDDLKIRGCSIANGIRIDNGGRLDLVAGAVFGVPPPALGGDPTP